MNKRFPRPLRFALLFAPLAVVTGCASVAVSNDAIEKNTAAALGLGRGAFVISDRQDEGVKSTYQVSTQSGKRYTCYVTGAVSVTGRVVSDAICSELGKPTKPAATTPAIPPSCNALLRAAGKCS